jgi:hypothetical protein
MILLLLTIISADFPVCTAPNYTEYPCVTYANNKFNIFWIDYRLSPSMSIYGSRVAKNGMVLNPNGVELYRDSASYRCNVAFDGNNFLVVTRNHC